MPRLPTNEKQQRSSNQRGSNDKNTTTRPIWKWDPSLLEAHYCCDQCSAPWPEFVNVDSCCFNIGIDGEGSVAGLGVHYLEADPRNIALPLKGEAQTIQRAELAAVFCAIRLASLDVPAVVVKIESEYTANCLFTWFPRWKANQWRTAKGAPVKNRDVIECLFTEIFMRRTKQQIFFWVGKKLGTDEGVKEARRAARLGAEIGKLAVVTNFVL